MPTPKQMEKLAAEAVRKSTNPAPNAALPAEYWESVLKDPRAGTNGLRLSQRRLSDIRLAELDHDRGLYGIAQDRGE